MGLLLHLKQESMGYSRVSNLSVITKHRIFQDVISNSQVWMSHGDTIDSLYRFLLLASTEDVRLVAAFSIKNEETFGFSIS